MAFNKDSENTNENTVENAALLRRRNPGMIHYGGEDVCKAVLVFVS